MNSFQNLNTIFIKLQPLDQPLGPIRHMGIGRCQTQTMRPFRINVHLHRLADRRKCRRKVERIADRNTGILGGMPDEGRRSLRIDLFIGCKQGAQCFIVDFITEQRTDRAVPDGAMLSVRGYGRYEIVGTDGVTRKGRLRLIAKTFL